MCGGRWAASTAGWTPRRIRRRSSMAGLMADTIAWGSIGRVTSTAGRPDSGPAVTREFQQWKRTAAAVGARPFACAADTEAVGAPWQATAVRHSVSTTVVAEPVPQKRPTRDRPRAHAPLRRP
ncbi:hypothetical protein TPY_0505 [Sulfobacillus acidophilus TPY]|nr:hypothetical protein TPY_0505 [Sulfobacillus acidophilus TPY]